jgi:hypothetical protein
MTDAIAGLVGLVVGGLVMISAVYVSELVMPRRKCPDCGSKFPRLAGALRSQRTCRHCGYLYAAA